jgi:AcrR family transcriptional regulator
VAVRPRPRLTRAEQQQRTRAALLDAAEHVFVDRGLQGASVEAITERAGYTRGAFYSNFASKEELFAELLQDRAYRRYRAMAQDSARGEGPATMREVGEQLAAMQAEGEGRGLFRLWLELRASGPARGRTAPRRSSARSKRRGPSRPPRPTTSRAP